MQRIAITLCSMVLFFSYGCSGEDRQEEGASRDNGQRPGLASQAARDAWERIKATPGKDYGRLIIDLNPTEWEPEPYEALKEYWRTAFRESFVAFCDFVRTDPSDDDIRWLVRRFGREGAQADARLAFAVFSACGDGSQFKDWEADAELFDLNVSASLFVDTAMRVRREQVRMFLEDPQRLARYYRAMLWWGEAAVPGTLGYFADQIEQGFKSADAVDYWEHAHGFLLLAHGTCQDDLLKDAEADDLRPLFVKWRQWLEDAPGMTHFDVISNRYVSNDSWRLWREYPEHDSWIRDGYNRGFIPAGGPFDDWSGPPIIDWVRGGNT